MRPIVQQQSAIEHPLNRLLGTEANVRLLRALYAAGSPLGRAQLASSAGLSPVGARRALAALVRTGLVEAHGSGRSGQYRLRAQHPLRAALGALFAAEARRAAQLWERLTELLGRLETSPIAAWARPDPGLGGEALQVIVVAGLDQLPALRSALRPALAKLERALDLMMELSLWTRADLALHQDELKAVHLLHGAPPTALLPRAEAPGTVGRRRRSHQDADREQQQAGAILASMIRDDASLVAKAARHLRGVLAKEGRPASDLEEWRSILENNSPSQIARLLESPSARATRLRQTSVFLPVLSAPQRQRLELARARDRGSKAT